MKGFSDEPRHDCSTSQFEIIRCGPGAGFRFTCLSDRWVGVNTHYNGNRSVLCTEDNCPSCQDGKLARWRGYVYGYATKSGKIAIVEFTEGIHHVFKAEHDARGTLRGCRINLYRKSGRKQGRLCADFESTIESPHSLPSPQDLQARLAKVFDVRYLTQSQDATDDVGTIEPHKRNGKASRSAQPKTR